MSNEMTTDSEASLVETPIERIGDSKRLRWFELFLLLLVAFEGPVLNGLQILRGGQSALPHLQNSRWTFGIFQEGASLLLLRYVLLRRRVRFADLGLK